MNNKKNTYHNYVMAFSLMLVISMTFSTFSLQSSAFAQNGTGVTDTEPRNIDPLPPSENDTGVTKEQAAGVTGPLPPPEVVPGLGQDEARGISNLTDLQKATGDNTDFFFGPQNLSDDTTVLGGMELSQSGAEIPGEQNRTYEGEVISNFTN